MVEVTIERDGRWLAEGRRSASSRPQGLLGCDAAFPVLHGPGRRGRQRPGPARVPRPALRRLGCRVLGALHRQARLQAAAEREPGSPRSTSARRARRAGGSGPRRFGQPLWVKPARLGSSVGIATASGPDGARRGGRGGRAATTRKVIVEAPAPGKEVECSLLGNAGAASPRCRARSSPRVRLVRLRGQVRGGRHGARVPAEISDAGDRAGAGAGARGSSTLCGCSGLARCDFFVDGERCSSTSSTRSPASPRPASTASCSRRAGSPTPSSATASSSWRSSATQRPALYEF